MSNREGRARPGKRATQPRTTHAQVLVDGTRVDRGLAGLFRLLWPLGVETCQSCEDVTGSGLVWIQFPEEAGALQFFKLVRRAVKFIEWENVAGSAPDEDATGRHWCVVSVRFPREDLPNVRKALKRALDRKRNAQRGLS
jgi:hypothetical protein